MPFAVLIALALFCLVALLKFSARYFRLVQYLLPARTRHIRLPFIPNYRDTPAILIAVIIKYLPGFKPIKLASFLDKKNGVFVFPPVTIEAPFEFSPALMAEYQRVVNSKQSSDSLQGSAFAMAALASPYMVYLVTHRGCPLMPLGSVNVSNRFEWLCAPHTRANGPYRLKAVFGGPDEEMWGRRVKRGIEIAVLITVFDNKDEAILRQIMRILSFLPTKHPPQPPSVHASSSGVNSTAASAPEHTMLISRKDTLAYAKFVADFNPIHVHPLLAKAFGQRGQIAHGNLVIAKALNEIAFAPNAPTWLEVNFLRPVILPSECLARHDVDQKTVHVIDKKTQKIHLVASYGSI